MGYYTKLGTAVGCLILFNPEFYRKMGYGHCMEAYFYMPRTSAIRSFGHKENLSYAEAGDRKRFWTITAHGLRAPTVQPSTITWTRTVFSTCPT